MGWSYGEAFEQAKQKKQINVIESDSDVTNFQMLSNDRVEVVISDDISAQKTLAELLSTSKIVDNIVKLDQPLSREKIYIAYPIRLNKGEVLNQFNQAILQLEKDGTLSKIVNKYLE